MHFFFLFFSFFARASNYTDKGIQTNEQLRNEENELSRNKGKRMTNKIVISTGDKEKKEKKKKKKQEQKQKQKFKHKQSHHHKLTRR